ncbi:MAG: MFS transporter [Paracoccaceae bacterium]
MDIQAQRGRWAVAAIFFANGFIMGAWAPQIPLLIPRHHITEAVLGLLILVLGAGAVTAMVFAGRMIAAVGSRRMVMIFGTLATPMLPLVVLAPSLWLVAPAMALMGALVGSMDVSMNANAVEVERRLGRAIMSSSHGFWSLGGFAGGAVGGLALARFGAVEQAVGVAVIAFIIVAVAAQYMISEAAAPAVPRGVPMAKAVIFPRNPALYILGLMALFSMVPEGAVLDWAALYLSKELGAGLAVSGLAYALNAGAMAGMRFLGDGVRNRYGAVATLRVSGLVAAVGITIAAAAPIPVVAIIGFAITGLGAANMVPIMFSAGGNHPGMSAGAGLATVTMIGYCGILIAPSAIGLVAEHIGFRLTYGVLAVLLVGVAFMAGRAKAADGRAAVAVELPLEGGM